jgi:CheY-like chemotaxis protein
VNARVLVVDDEPYLREIITEYLRTRGFEVLEAPDGLEALLKFRSQAPDAVVLDIMMPRLGGLRALQRIRSFDPGITVVAVTGSANADLQREIMAAGATAILEKPINLEDLWRALGGSAGLPFRRQRAQPVPANPRTEPGRVLIVDDEEEFRAVLEEFVRKQGYRARTAANGRDGLRLIREDPPDVMLLDIHMPGLSGLDALNAIREASPNVKVIMVSGTTDFELAKETLARGAFDFVPKPPDWNLLGRSLETAHLMKRLEDELGQGDPGGGEPRSGSSPPTSPGSCA